MRLTGWHWVGVGFGGLLLLSAISAAVGGGAENEIAGPASVRPIGPEGFFAVTLSPSQDADELPAMARDICEDRIYCNVMAWRDASETGRGMPLTQREADAMAFSYAVNRSSGHEQVVWNCSLFPRLDRAQCM